MAVPEENWQTVRPTIRERCLFIFNNELFSDIKFVVQDSNGESESSKKLIPAHKLVLSISSPVFLAMFYGEMAESADSIEMPDCDYESLLELFRYMYSDEVKLTGSNVIQVLYLAKKYIVPSLADKCSKFLQDNLEPSNVFCILPQALKFDEKGLVDECWKVIDKWTTNAVKSDGFVTLERTLVKSVITRDSLDVSEVELFKAVDRWAAADCERQGFAPDGAGKRRVLGEDLIKAMRFPLMSEKQFVATVPDCNILTTKEIVDMMKYFNGLSMTSLPFVESPRNNLQSLATFGAVFKIGEFPETFCFSVNKPIDLYGVRLSTKEKRPACIASVKVKQAGKRRILGEKQCVCSFEKGETDSHHSFEAWLDNPVRLLVNVKYELSVSIPEVVTHDGEEESVDCSGLTFTFSQAKAFSNKPMIPELIFRKVC